MKEQFTGDIYADFVHLGETVDASAIEIDQISLVNHEVLLKMHKQATRYKNMFDFFTKQTYDDKIDKELLLSWYDFVIKVMRIQRFVKSKMKKGKTAKLQKSQKLSVKSTVKQQNKYDSLVKDKTDYDGAIQKLQRWWKRIIFLRKWNKYIEAGGRFHRKAGEEG